jgi:hypothetical protein
MVIQNTKEYISMDIPKSGLMNLQNHINPNIKLHHAEEFAEFEKYNRELRTMVIKNNHPRSSDNHTNGGKHKLSRLNNYSS